MQLQPFSHAPCSIIPCLLLGWMLCASTPVSAQIQESDFAEGLLTLPVVVVDGTSYRITMTLQSTSPTVDFVLTDITPLTDVSQQGAAVFDVASLNLNVPSLRVEGLLYYAVLNLVTVEAPYLFRIVDAGELVTGPAAAAEFFSASIEQPIIQTTCILCHVSGGVADGQTSLLYERTSATSTEFNFNLWQVFIASRSDAIEYVLAKVTGGENHTGGNVLPNGSAKYNDLLRFLLQLTGSSSGGTGNSVNFFDGITLQNNLTTLRKAAIKIAGRLPTAAEQTQVTAGNDATLRQVLRDLMQGDGFHEFIKDGANDRLLVRGLPVGVRMVHECLECFPAYSNLMVEAEIANRDQGLFAVEQGFFRRSNHALKEAPLELIAYVVENDRPYSEILTANYMMMTPLINQAFGGTAVFNDPANQWEFQPGQVQGMYLVDDSQEYIIEPGIIAKRITNPGNLQTDLPHAGVLNSRAFLSRYPTTATNRNRARARWTYYHFMDLDIERSAQRTNDPIALADTNNPTLNNPNCTVCHIRMDPVAGAFQNYAPEGQYRVNFGGLSSLDPFYLHPVGKQSLYQDGDTWYRDMREPGFLEQLAPDPDNSVQWLAQQIVMEPAFATAAVKFWWPTVIGSELLLAPTVDTDTDYQARLQAFDAQTATIDELTSVFINSGMNLKTLLVEMLMTPWFRVESVNPAQLTDEILEAHAIVRLGNEKLLTPEQLQRKTTSITGFTWNNYWNIFTLEQNSNGMERLFGLFYGGIDSDGVIKRTRDMTPMMSTVPIVHALESACPIVLREFALPDVQRKLFAGISDTVTPNNGEQVIRQKIAELYEKMLGQRIDSETTEITEIYNLFVDSWIERNQLQIETSLFNSVDFCVWKLDTDFGVGLAPVGDGRDPTVRYDGKLGYAWRIDFEEFLVAAANDPFRVKQSWIPVISYLMSHYDYLYE